MSDWRLWRECGVVQRREQCGPIALAFLVHQALELLIRMIGMGERRRPVGQYGQAGTRRQNNAELVHR